MERTPLRRDALDEMLRVVAVSGEVIVRHVPLSSADRHDWLHRYLRARVVVTGRCRIGGQWVQETRLREFNFEVVAQRSGEC